MAQIVEFPVAAGGVLRVQAADGLPGSAGQELVPATSLVPATGVGEKVQQAKETLESAIGSVTPALGVMTRQLRKLAPDEVTIEFGLVLSAEQGVVVAKASGEVHFTVTLAWKAAGTETGAAAGTEAGTEAASGQGGGA